MAPSSSPQLDGAILEVRQKVCTSCRQSKTAEDNFGKKSNGYFRSECWECLRLREEVRRRAKTPEEKAAHAKACREWQQAHKEYLRVKRATYRKENLQKVRALNKKWNDTHPERRLFTGAKSRSKKNGLPFSLVLADILPLPIHCPVLGIPLRKGQYSDDPNSYSLDRVVPELGYVPGNVVVISRRANVLKRDATKTEILLMAKWISARMAIPHIQEKHT